MQRLQDQPIMVKRLKQILNIFLVGIVCAILLTAFANKQEGQLVSSSTSMLLLGLLSLLWVAYLFRRGKRAFATLFMLCTVTVVMCVTSWSAGGLHSVGIIIFPVILLATATYAEPKYFIPIFTVLLAAIILFGLNSIYGWFLPPDGLFLTGGARLVGFLVAYSVCGLLVWLVGKDLRYAFSVLENEKAQMAESNSVIKRLADRDSLTGLLSYQSAVNLYQELTDKLDIGNEKIVFYFIDLDNFKQVNDIYDHSTGDELLVKFSQRLSSIADKETVVCRVGGDEFVLFKVVDIDEDVSYLSDQLVRLVSSEFYKVSSMALRISASMGVSQVEDDTEDFASVRKKADMAMIQAKQSGKNGYHHYSESLEDAYMANLTIINGLKQAVPSGLLDLSFQPQVNLKTKQVVGASSSIVWARDNPQGHQLKDFWPIIETTELVHDIGAWAIIEACKAYKVWLEHGYDIAVSVDISAVQLTRTSFAEVVGEIVKTAGIPAQKLLLVMPEDSFYEDEGDNTEQQITQLKQLGVELAIGGFGNGYSNLTQLTDLDIDCLFIDQNFVSKVCNSESTGVVVAAITDVANQFHMMVNAQSVISKEQVEALTKLGCHCAQGDYWAVYQSTDQLLMWLSRYKEQPALLVG